MTLGVNDVLGPMLDAARGSLADDWPRVRRYVEPALARLAEELIAIQARIAAGEIEGAQAAALSQIHANTVRTVMLTGAGLAIVAAENALNAALAAARGVLAHALGVSFI
jgi:hypothetical protein